MVTELLVIWIVAVVAFFTLWAILAKVVHKISERKNNDEKSDQEESTEKSDSADQPS